MCGSALEKTSLRAVEGVAKCLAVVVIVVISINITLLVTTTVIISIITINPLTSVAH